MGSYNFREDGSLSVQCALMGKRIHPLLKPCAERGPGMHVAIFVRNTLHCVDLGTSQCVLASVMWLLVFGGYVCANAGDAIRTVHGVIKEIIFPRADALPLYKH